MPIRFSGYAALVMFVLASLGCALATGMGSFLAFRLAQAVIISGYSVTLAVIRKVRNLFWAGVGLALIGAHRVSGHALGTGRRET